MLKSQNFAVINCLECGEVIKIEPGVLFDTDFHTCPKKPATTNKPTVAVTKEVKKEKEANKKSFIEKLTGK